MYNFDLPYILESMIIKLKNKDTLICDDFQFKCSIGENGLKK